MELLGQIILGILSILASIGCGILFPLVMSYSKKLQSSREDLLVMDGRLKLLEKEQEHLKNGVGTQIKGLKDQVTQLSKDLKAHMDEEPHQIQEALRAVLKDMNL